MWPRWAAAPLCPDWWMAGGASGAMWEWMGDESMRGSKGAPAHRAWPVWLLHLQPLPLTAGWTPVSATITRSLWPLHLCLPRSLYSLGLSLSLSLYSLNRSVCISYSFSVFLSNSLFFHISVLWECSCQLTGVVCVVYSAEIYKVKQYVARILMSVPLEFNWSLYKWSQHVLWTKLIHCQYTVIKHLLCVGSSSNVMSY